MTSDKLRGAILRVLYARWQTVDNILMADVESTDLATQLGLDLQDVNRQAQYLSQKTPPLLVDQYISGDRFYRLTTEGIDFVEHPDKYPQYRSLTVIHAGGDVSVIGSQLTSRGNFQSSVTSWDPGQVAALIQQLRDALDRAEVETSLRHDVTADLDSLSAQARRTVPNRAVLWATFQAFSTTVQAAAALHDLWPLLPALRALTFPRVKRPRPIQATFWMSEARATRRIIPARDALHAVEPAQGAGPFAPVPRPTPAKGKRARLAVRKRRDWWFKRKLETLRQQIRKPKPAWWQTMPMRDRLRERLRIALRFLPPVQRNPEPVQGDVARELATLQFVLLLEKERVPQTVRDEVKVLLKFVKMKLRDEGLAICRGQEGQPEKLIARQKRTLVERYNDAVAFLRHQPEDDDALLDAARRWFPESRVPHMDIVNAVQAILKVQSGATKKAARKACALAYGVSDSYVQGLAQRAAKAPSPGPDLTASSPSQ